MGASNETGRIYRKIIEENEEINKSWEDISKDMKLKKDMKPKIESLDKKGKEILLRIDGVVECNSALIEKYKGDLGELNIDLLISLLTNWKLVTRITKENGNVLEKIGKDALDFRVKVKKTKKDIEKLVGAVYDDEEDLKEGKKIEKVLRINDARIVREIDEKRKQEDKKVQFSANSLFPTDGHPNAKDVRQGTGREDCYLMSSLKGIVKKNYKVIEKCFPDFKNGCQSDEDKNRFLDMRRIKVLLFKIPKLKPNDGEHIMEPKEKVLTIIDKSSIDLKQKTDVWWVQLLKKAIIINIVKYKPTIQVSKNPVDKNSIERFNVGIPDDLNLGNLQKLMKNNKETVSQNEEIPVGVIKYVETSPYIEFFVTAMITGKPVSVVFKPKKVNLNEPENLSAEKHYKFVKDKFDKGYAVLFGCFAPKDEKLDAEIKKKLRFRHVYYLSGFNSKGEAIVADASLADTDIDDIDDSQAKEAIRAIKKKNVKGVAVSKDELYKYFTRCTYVDVSDKKIVPN